MRRQLGVPGSQAARHWQLARPCHWQCHLPVSGRALPRAAAAPKPASSPGVSRPGKPQFPFPRFRIWPGNGEGRIGKRGGNPRFPTRPESGTGNREIPRFLIRPGTGNGAPIGCKSGNRDTLRVRVQQARPSVARGLDVASSGSFKCRFWPPSLSFLNCQCNGPADGGWRLRRGDEDRDGGLLDGFFGRCRPKLQQV